MDLSMYIQLVPILQGAIIGFFALGLISLLFLTIRIRYFKKSFKKWIKESKRLSKDPTLDKIIKTYRLYKEKGFNKTNTEAIIKSSYNKQRIFFIPIYYWEQIISKTEILTLFLGLLATFILVSEKIDSPFYPLIGGTASFIFLIGLEMILALPEKRNLLFIEIEEYLDNSYLPSMQRVSMEHDIFKEGKSKSFSIYGEEKEKNNVETDMKDEEIEWLIQQFYREEKGV